MAITINNTTVASVTLNNSAISSVTCNGTVVFTSRSDYTFPNSGHYASANSMNASYQPYSIRIEVTGSWPGHEGYRAMDTSASTYWATKTSNSDNTERFTVTFPFNVKINSVKITNPTGRNTGMTYGYVFVSTAASGENWQTLASFQGRSGSGGNSTTYSCPSNLASLTNIRRVRVSGTAWASSEEHSVGEIAISFNAANADLHAYSLI